MWRESFALDDAEVVLWHEVWDGPAAAELLVRLLAQTEWRQHRVRLFGKRIAAPRLSAWHGEPAAHYRYSGVELAPLPWTDTLDSIRAVAQRLAGAAFNSVLLNRYRSGADSMGWHSDDEPELGRDPVIASASFGAPRVFALRHRRGDARLRLELPPGSLLVMAAATQHHWRHSLPKTRRAIGERVNLTFREIRPGAPAPGGRANCSS